VVLTHAHLGCFAVTGADLLCERFRHVTNGPRRVYLRCIANYPSHGPKAYVTPTSQKTALEVNGGLFGDVSRNVRFPLAASQRISQRVDGVLQAALTK